VKPRSYFGSSQQIQRLQVFEDASPSAFGAAAYFVNNNQTAFIMAKIRVAPLKIVGREKPTIPLMELMAALLGVQLATTIINAMKKARVDITEVTMWCANQPVLFWIDELEPNKCKVIRNRVNKIQSFTRQYQAAWRYVPTDQNPADLLTRGIDLEQFSSSKLWKFGPDWLSNSSAWPKWSISQIKRPQVLVLPSPSLNESDVSPSKKPDVSAIIEPSRHRWSSLLRVTAVTQRVCKNFELKWKKQPTIEGPITASELLAAEVKWIRSVQQRFLSLELEYLQGDKRGRRPQLVSHLDLFLDQESSRANVTWRCQHNSLQHPTAVLDLFNSSTSEISASSLCNVPQVYWQGLQSYRSRPSARFSCELFSSLHLHGDRLDWSNHGP